MIFSQETCNKKRKLEINVTLCEALEIDMGTQVGGLNPYALDFPTCVEASSGGNNRLPDKKKKGSRAQLIWAMNYMLPDHMKVCRRIVDTYIYAITYCVNCHNKPASLFGFYPRVLFVQR